MEARLVPAHPCQGSIDKNYLRVILPTLTPKNKKELLNPYDTRDQELSFGFEM